MFANKKNLKIAVGAVGLVVAGIVLFFVLKKKITVEPMVQKVSEDTLKLTDEAIKNIKLEKVFKGDFPEKLSLMGKISVPEDRTIVVQARISGRTDKVFVASGEVVAPGQPLASIFSADFAIAREEYLEALKDVQKSPNDEEAKHLFELSKRKLDALGVSTVDASKWTENSGKINELGGDNMIVRAPRGGALLSKTSAIGSLVNVGDPLFTIGDLSKVWFAGDIYPEDLNKVHKNQEVVIAANNDSVMLHGKVSFISPVIDPTSRTIKIRALMDNPGSQLRADMYVQGSIVLSTRIALVAPKNALVRLGDTVFCFKRIPGNQFKKVFVKAESESGDKISVSDGLVDGDEVVSEGGLLLNAALSDSGAGE